jgi:DNA repair photolyase
MPGINDSPAQIEELLARVTEAKATSVGGIALHLRGEVRQVFMGWLREQRPDLVPRYEQLYRKGAYAPPQERKRLSELIRRRGQSRRFVHARPDPVGAAQPPAPARVAQQTLF